MNRGFLGHHGPCHRGLHFSTVAHRCRPSSRTSQRVIHVCASATGDVFPSLDAAAEQVPTTTAAGATAAVATVADKKQRQLPDRFLTPPKPRRPGSNATALPSPAAEAINTAAAALLRVLGTACESSWDPQYVQAAAATAKAVAALLQPSPGFDWLVWQHKAPPSSSGRYSSRIKEVRKLLKAAGIIGVNIGGANTWTSSSSSSTSNGGSPAAAAADDDADTSSDSSVSRRVFLMYVGDSMLPEQAQGVVQPWEFAPPPWLQAFLRNPPSSSTAFCFVRTQPEAVVSAETEEVVPKKLQKLLKRQQQALEQLLQLQDPVLQPLQQLLQATISSTQQQETPNKQQQQQQQGEATGAPASNSAAEATPAGTAGRSAAQEALDAAGVALLQVLTAALAQALSDQQWEAVGVTAQALGAMLRAAPSFECLLFQHPCRHLCDTSYWQRILLMRPVLRTANVTGVQVKSQSKGHDAFLMSLIEHEVQKKPHNQGRIESKQRKWVDAFTSEPLSPDRAFRMVPSASGSAVDVPAGFDPMTNMQLLLDQQHQALEQLLQLQDAALEPLQQQLSSLAGQASAPAAAAATSPPAAAAAAAAAADVGRVEVDGSGAAAAATEAAVADQGGSANSDLTDDTVVPAAGINFNNSSGGGGGGSGGSGSGPDSSSGDPTDHEWQALLVAQREGVGSAMLQLLEFVLGSWPQVQEELPQSLVNVAEAVEWMLRTDGFEFLVWQTDLKDSELAPIRAALEGGPVQSSILTSRTASDSSSLLLFYGSRIFQTHTVTSVRSLVAQFEREPPAWLQQVLQQKGKDTPCLALVHIPDPDQQATEQQVVQYQPGATAAMISTVRDKYLLLVEQAEAATSAAETAVEQYKAKQQQRQQEAYKKVLRSIYAANNSSKSSSSSSTEAADSSSSGGSSITEQLLSVLRVSPPEGTADSFDCLTAAWSNWTNGPSLDLDRILGPGAKPTGVQSWLLPQLLDDAQPPLLVVAPPGTGRVTAVLLAAAAELAAAAAEQQEAEGDEGDEGQGQPLAVATAADDEYEGEEEYEYDEAAAEALVVPGAEQQPVEASSSSGSGAVAAVGSDGWFEPSASLDAAAVLPWEEDGSFTESGSIAAAAAAEASSSSSSSTQQPEGLEQPASPGSAEAAAEDVAAADGAICSPFLLLLLPNQAAAEAAAAQHGPVMAAAGARLAVLPAIEPTAEYEAAVERVRKAQAESDEEIMLLKERVAADDESLEVERQRVEIIMGEVSFRLWDADDTGEGDPVDEGDSYGLRCQEAKQRWRERKFVHAAAQQRLQQLIQQQEQRQRAAALELVSACQQQLRGMQAVAGVDMLVATPQLLSHYFELFRQYSNAMCTATGRPDAFNDYYETFIDFSQVYWLVVDEDGLRQSVQQQLEQQEQEASSAASSLEDALYEARSKFREKVAVVSGYLPKATREVDQGFLTLEVQMSRAARAVYLAEELQSTGNIFELFSVLQQGAALKRMLLVQLPQQAAAAASSSTGKGGASSSQVASASGQAAAAPRTVCRLFPDSVRWLLRCESNFRSKLAEYVLSRVKPFMNSEVLDFEFEAALEAFDVIRLTDITALARIHPDERASETAVQREQQRQELVLSFGQTATEKRKKAERGGAPYNRGMQLTRVLQRLAEAREPAVNVKLYSYRHEQDKVWEDVVVFRQDDKLQPDYRADRDPSRPTDLKFDFPQSAQELLTKQLPRFAQEQQELLQLAAEQGLLPEDTAAAAAGAAASSSSDAGSTGQIAKKWSAQRKGMSRAGRAALKEHLKGLRQKLPYDAEYAAIQRQRGKLPAAAMKQQLLEALEQHQVLLVTGDTGCGKSTQVPQFILEAADEAGQLHNTRILAAQPRRLITTALAQRVAAERGEQVGQVVGYSIHANRMTSRITRLTFCTTGILIRRLMVDPELASVTHVIIDEVHERGLEVDFLLTAMRQLAAVRPDLKLLLMSATVDTQKLVDYMGSAIPGTVGALHIEGNTFPVEQFYLEDLIEAGLRTAVAAHRREQALRKQQDDGDAFLQRLHEIDKDTFVEAAVAAVASSNFSIGSSPSSHGPPPGPNQLPEDHELASIAAAVASMSVVPYDASIGVDNYKPHMDYSLKGRARAAVLEYQVDKQQLRREGYSPATILELQRWCYGVASPKVFKSREQHTNTVVAAITFIVEHEPNPGAILVFLPSWQAISDVYSALDKDPSVFERCITYVLHSSLPMSEQQEVFQHAPTGYRKLILATNIAESSITFDDVTVVINSCRVNVASFDPINNMPQLGPQWASKASLWQRRGRAGRVQRGMAIHLVPKAMAQHHMEPYDLPEMRRVPLVDVCLLVTSLGITDIAAFLAAAPDPPAAKAVDKAISDLQALGALTPDLKLTSLGRLLALLPGDIKATRMVIYGALLGVLDPVLTLAAAATGEVDGTRMPMMSSPLAAITRSSTDSGQSDGEGTGAAESSVDTGMSSRESFLDARSQREERRLQLAGSNTNDYAVTLAAYKEFLSCKAREGRPRGPAGFRQTRMPLWKMLQQNLLSERDLGSINTERLQYTQLLYRAGFLVPTAEFLEERRRRFEAKMARSAAQQQRFDTARLARAAQTPEGYQWYDLILDDELADMEPEMQQLLQQVQASQQQQPGFGPNVTAMDWVLGEYADAAGGSHSLLTLEEEGGYLDSAAAGGSRYAGSYNSSDAAGAAADAGGQSIVDVPSELGSSDLQRLVQQYSWNVDKHPLLLEAVLAAGLYPNYAFGSLRPKVKKQLESGKDAADGQLCRLSARDLAWRAAEDGPCSVHMTSILAKRMPKFRWAAFSTKRLQTETNTLNLLACNTVPDLAVLMFSSDLKPSLPKLPEQEAEKEEEKDVEHTIFSRVALSYVRSVLDEMGRSGSAELLGGFAAYRFDDPDDLAALVWMRSHMQLLLELAVAGQSAQVLDFSRSFSGLLGQLMELSVEEGERLDVTRLYTQQQAALQRQAEKAAAQKAAELEKAAARVSAG